MPAQLKRTGVTKETAGDVPLKDPLGCRSPRAFLWRRLYQQLAFFACFWASNFSCCFGMLFSCVFPRSADRGKFSPRPALRGPVLLFSKFRRLLSYSLSLQKSMFLFRARGWTSSLISSEAAKSQLLTGVYFFFAAPALPVSAPSFGAPGLVQDGFSLVG